MKVIKPSKVAVVTRSFEQNREFSLGISAMLFVPLGDARSSGPGLLSEVDMWKFVADQLGKDAGLDMGIPKFRGEYLVHGSAYTPSGVPQPAIPIRAIVGPLDKSLYVFGDRYWHGGAASEPRAFAEMPLDWTRAYGGADYPRNPLGRGVGETVIAGHAIHMLPNVESPQERVESPRRHVEPAGFGPIDLSWPQRQALAGTYDQAWLEQLFPGFPRDIDWSFFNIAPADQQRRGFWTGHEDYQFDNLHPSKPQVRGRLPGFVARSFVVRGPRRKRGAEAQTAEELELQLEEVALSLQTLWFFPNAERAVLIFQGSVPVDTDDATDIRCLMLAAESDEVDEARPTSHYARALAARLDRKQAMLAALREQDLLPPGQASALGSSENEALFASEDAMSANLHRRALAQHEQHVAHLRSLGVPPEMFPVAPAPPQPAPELQDVPAIVERLLADADAQRIEQEANCAVMREQTDARVAAAGLDPDELRSKLDAGHTGPPTFTAAGQRAVVATAVATLRAEGHDASPFEAMLADPETQAQWQLAERQGRDAYRLTAHHQSPAPRLDDLRSADARIRLLEAIRDAEDLSTLNFTGANLVGLDLRGANLAGACLESARLDRVDLTGANLTHAIVAHASLAGAKLDGCDLTGTNLGKTDLRGASLTGTRMVETILHAADLSAAVLHRAYLHKVDLIGAVLQATDASEIQADQFQLIETRCQGLILRAAKLERAAFIELDLTGSDFSGASLPRSAFIACKLAGVSFAKTDLSKACFVENCDLRGAQFPEAQLACTNLRGSFMTGCEFSGATLDGADLSECELSGSRFYRTLARGTRFEKADLSDAVFMSANLMRASFQNATIRGADFRASNLYAADMARVRSDTRVQFGEAILSKVRVLPTHVESGGRR